jgi:hypothetical protein
MVRFFIGEIKMKLDKVKLFSNHDRDKLQVELNDFLKEEVKNKRIEIKNVTIIPQCLGAESVEYLATVLYTEAEEKKK